MEEGLKNNNTTPQTDYAREGVCAGTEHTAGGGPCIPAPALISSAFSGWLAPATRLCVAAAAEGVKQALCTRWVLPEGKPFSCYSRLGCKVGPSGMTLRRPLLASALSHTLGVRRRSIDQVPPLPRSHAPQRARPRIPAHSPTTRSCRGARARA